MSSTLSYCHNFNSIRTFRLNFWFHKFKFKIISNLLIFNWTKLSQFLILYFMEILLKFFSRFKTSQVWYEKCFLCVSRTRVGSSVELNVVWLSVVELMSIRPRSNYVAFDIVASTKLSILLSHSMLTVEFFDDFYWIFQ